MINLFLINSHYRQEQNVKWVNFAQWLPSTGKTVFYLLCLTSHLGQRAGRVKNMQSLSGIVNYKIIMGIRIAWVTYYTVHEFYGKTNIITHVWYFYSADSSQMLHNFCDSQSLPFKILNCAIKNQARRKQGNLVLTTTIHVWAVFYKWVR